MHQKIRIVLFLLLGLLFIAVSFIPDLVSDELKALCLEKFGPKYPWYLLGFFVVGTFILLWIGDIKSLLGIRSLSADPKHLNIPWSWSAKQRLQQAKQALADADPQTALRLLQEFDSPSLNDTLILLSTQLANYQAENIAGTLGTDEKNVGFNKLTKRILSLINSIESNFSEQENHNRNIRDSIRKRYQERLSQKMALRQAVKLRKWVSKEGTSELIAATFKTYPEQAIPEEIGKLFQDAHGRLLIVGQPGMGKTTLLLELADRLFDLEVDALPLLINLASWKSDFNTLENWLEEVLPSELSTNKSGAKAVLQQSNLILLLDGLDELKEPSEMASCLAAIAEYGATAGRRFVITCRIEDYKAIQEDARVNLQIEVGSLDATELIAELDKIGYQQPEAKALAQALRSDELLQEVVTTPFYFNTLQLLYAGKTPVFTTTDLDARKSEIEQKFIEYALQPAKLKAYKPEDAQRWLSFLASSMTDKSKVVFELVDLQYGWQKWTKSEKFVAYQIRSLIAGLSSGIVLSLTLSLAFGLVFGLVFGLAKKSLILGIINGLYLGLVFGLMISLFLGVAICLIFGLTENIKLFWPTIETKDRIVGSLTFGNYTKEHLVLSLAIGLFVGLLAAVFNGIFIGLFFFLFTIFFVFLIEVVKFEITQFIRIDKPYQRFNGFRDCFLGIW
jgi:Effector-associated domain 11/NACHT domain